MKILGASVVVVSGRNHHGPQLPDAVNTFYNAVEGSCNCDELWRVVHDDVVWIHTGIPTQKGKQDICNMLLSDSVHSQISDTTTVDKVSSVSDGFIQAESVIVQRFWGNIRNYGKREGFIITNGKIMAVMTTNASPDDPTDETGQHSWVGSESTVEFHTVPEGELEVVQKAVDVYFDAFERKNPSMMRSAYSQDPIYLFDFNQERQTPFGCSMSSDCATAPFFNQGDQLLPAFQGFCAEPGHIELNRQTELGIVMGNLAFIITTSYGCEGIYVTPDGTDAMPNREIYAVVNRDGQWKIQSYMFTFDPAPTLTPPTQTCFNNGALTV